MGNPARKDLPTFVEPMLAVPGRPFDSDRHVFEIKWDGYRAIVRRDDRGYRLWSRNRKDLTEQFPELCEVEQLPPGCILDGEIVVLRDGVPDFGALQRRKQDAAKGDTVLVLFDLLFDRGASLLQEPLVSRRERLEALVSGISPRLLFSQGIVGSGVAFFEQVGKRGLEGITAKRLDGPYLPGRRTDSWVKIKHRRELQCAVVGFLSNESGGLRSLAVAADVGSGLCYVGQVGSGFSVPDLGKLQALLQERRADRPIVACPRGVLPVSPGLYCVVSFVEFTDEGLLRAPVCESWALDP